MRRRENQPMTITPREFMDYGFKIMLELGGACAVGAASVARGVSEAILDAGQEARLMTVGQLVFAVGLGLDSGRRQKRLRSAIINDVPTDKQADSASIPTTIQTHEEPIQILPGECDDLSESPQSGGKDISPPA